MKIQMRFQISLAGVILAAAALTVLLSVPLHTVPAAAAQGERVALPQFVMPQVGPAFFTGTVGTTSYSPYICTLAVTTTADSICPQCGFSNAAVLASYATLVLAPGNKGQQVQAYDQYFRLDNTVPDALYKIEAVPNSTSNYNLGIIAYDSTLTPILTDTNPVDYRADLSFRPTTIGPYYFKISQISNYCTGGSYKLQITYSAPAATATATTSPKKDGYEDNNTYTDAKEVPLGTYSNLTFYPLPDEDWFKILAKAKREYRVETQITTGLDTVIEIRDMDLDLVASNDDRSYSDYSSLVEWNTGSSDVWYYVVVKHKGVVPSNPTYTLIISLVTQAVEPTDTPLPPATAVTGYDRFEPNHNFNRATIISLDTKYDKLNFVPYAPWNGHMEDNDFFKLHVKTGMLVTCATSNLSPGTDTNMIMFSETQADDCGNRSVEECPGLAGNDDVNTAAGDFSSRLSYFATYEGWLYILVGQGHPVPLTEASKYTYEFQCSVGAQATATPTPEPSATLAPFPTAMPTPLPTWTLAPADTPTPMPAATPTPLPPISVRPLPTLTPAGPPRQVVNVELHVFYDHNENNQADPSEGVIGLQAQVYDLADGALLAQGFTDETGTVALSVSALGMVKVVVSYMNFEVIVPPSGGALQVRVSPRQLPQLIP